MIKISGCGMQVSRFLPTPPSLEEVFEQVQYWRAEPGSVDAKYYAYVLNALMAMDGSLLSLQRHEQYLEECRELTRFRRKRDLSYEWLGEGRGIARVVHQSRLGGWDHARGFWKNTAPLKRVPGRVARHHRPPSRIRRVRRRIAGFLRSSRIAPLVRQRKHSCPSISGIQL